MAAGNHDAALMRRERVGRQRWRRNTSQIHRLHAGIQNRAFDCLGQLAPPLFGRNVLTGTGAEIVGIEKLLAVYDATLLSWQRLQILDLSPRVDVDLKLGKIHNQPSAATRPKLQLAWLVV